MTRALAFAAALLASAAPAAAAEPLVLGAPKDFAAGVALVERATGATAEPLAAASGAPLPDGRSFAVESRVAERLLAGSHATFRSAGLYLFRYERSFGVGGEKDRIALLPTGDFEQVVRRMGTSGGRHKVPGDKIVAWLRALEKDEPFDLWEVGPDYVAGRFDRTPRDPRAIAERSVQIAPDLVAGRATTLDVLVEEIRANRTLYLLWD